MKIPELYDWMNPEAPKWSNVSLGTEEIDGLFQACVMIVGYDPRPDAQDRYRVIGSGFLISAEGKLTILTAAHIFIWWADQIYPPAPHALRGAQGDAEDVAIRLRRVLENGHIAAAVARRGLGGGGEMCSIEHISMNPRPADGDIAIVQISIPQGRGPDDYRILRLDADPFDFQEPVLIAGFIGGGRNIAIDDTQNFGLAYWEQKLAVRAGRVAEYVSDEDHQHRYMYRVRIPSLPGMSGGPLIALRDAHSITYPHVEPTAIGVVSRSGFAEPLLPDHCEEGDTWVIPVAHALARKVRAQQGICTLSDAIRTGSIDAFGNVARRATVSRDPQTGHVTYALSGDA